jgi:hypothetical protein
LLCLGFLYLDDYYGLEKDKVVKFVRIAITESKIRGIIKALKVSLKEHILRSRGFDANRNVISQSTKVSTIYNINDQTNTVAVTTN